MRETVIKTRLNNNQKGITLIALVITIIVLLILAGVVISMLSGENGILKQAAKAKEEQARAQTLEEIQLTYLSEQMKNQGQDEDTIISKTIEELKNNGYKIETDQTTVTTIKNIKYMLNNGQIEETVVKKGNTIDVGIIIEKEVKETNLYYVEINNKYYLLTIDSNDVTIGDAEVDITGLGGNSEESIIEVISNDTGVATVVLNETDSEKNIKITGINVGETTITTKTSLGKIAILKVGVTNNATGITISSTNGNTIKVGATTTLTATLSPIDASDSNIIWSVEDTTIAQINTTNTAVTSGKASVVVTGVAKGTVKITATAGGVSSNYTVTVEEAFLEFSAVYNGALVTAKAKEGMTWEEFVNNPEYNTIGLWIWNDAVMYGDSQDNLDSFLKGNEYMPSFTFWGKTSSETILPTFKWEKIDSEYFKDREITGSPTVTISYTKEKLAEIFEAAGGSITYWTLEP